MKNPMGNKSWWSSWKALYRKQGWRGFLKEKGWTVVLLFFLIYAIRDSVLYLVLPYLIWKGIWPGN